MPGRRDLIARTLALLLTAGALSAVMGCARADQPTESPLATSTETSASTAASGQVSAATTPPAAAAAGSGAPGDSASGESAGDESVLSPQDASTLDAELSAIQSELDRLSVPGDDDFDSIGDGLK